MSRRQRVLVQHCVLSGLVRKHGARPVFDLLEVSYEYNVAADTEFPKYVPRFDLFLRIIGRSAGPTRLRIRVRRWRGKRQWELVGDFPSPSPLALPVTGVAVLSLPVRLSNVRLSGPGLYAVTVYVRPRRARWGIGATEYFRVVR